MNEYLHVDKQKKALEKLRPFSSETIKSLKENILLEWTYNSNAIEGNTLTLLETKVVLEGITIGGKSVREHLEVINHKDAILYLDDIVKNNEPFSEWQIKNIHNLVLKGINDKYAGTYRDQQVMISGAMHTPPAPYLLKEKMDNFINWYNNDGQKLHPVERAAMVHVIFVGIHPFIDGNGRTSRLLLNLELMKNGFSPIVIKNVDRLQYYASLDKAHTTGDNTDFIGLIVNEVKNMLEQHIDLCKNNAGCR